MLLIPPIRPTLASTDLPGGRLGVIVDTGAWTNLWGKNFAHRLVHKAKPYGLTASQNRLRQPLYIAGVGSGSQQANWELNIPIATTTRDGVTTQHSMRALAVERGVHVEEFLTFWMNKT